MTAISKSNDIRCGGGASRTMQAGWSAVGPDSGAESKSSLLRAKEDSMISMPQWIKPVIWGAVGGSVVTMIIGFSYGGWTTSDTAARLARQQAEVAVTAALVPLCIAQSKADRAVLTKMGELKALTSSYEQRDFVTKTGWATVPGSEDPNRDVADACAAALLKTASK